MAYLAVNEDGKEVRLDRKEKPMRFDGRWVQISDETLQIKHECGKEVHLGYFGQTIPFGSIIAMTGQKLTWNDEPIRI